MIDSFLYFNETDLFFLRIQYLDSHVRRFVIVETDTTFSCQPHPAQFDRVYQQLSSSQKQKIDYHYLRIDHSVFEPGEENFKNNSRHVEREMRNALATVIKSVGQDEYMMMSDLDEFPDTRCLDAARRLVDQHGKMFWAQDTRAAYFDWQMQNGRWPGTKMCHVSNMPDPIQDLYMSKNKTWGTYGDAKLEAGWHFTLMGDAAMKQQQIVAKREGPGWQQKLNKTGAEIAQGMTRGQYNQVVKKGKMRAEKVGVGDLDPALVALARQYSTLWSGAVRP